MRSLAAILPAVLPSPSPSSASRGQSRCPLSWLGQELTMMIGDKPLTMSVGLTLLGALEIISHIVFIQAYEVGSGIIPSHR